MRRSAAIKFQPGIKEGAGGRYKGSTVEVKRNKLISESERAHQSQKESFFKKKKKTARINSFSSINGNPSKTKEKGKEKTH